MTNQSSAADCYTCNTMSNGNCADPFIANGIRIDNCDAKCFVCVFRN